MDCFLPSPSPKHHEQKTRPFLFLIRLCDIFVFTECFFPIRFYRSDQIVRACWHIKLIQAKDKILGKGHYYKFYNIKNQKEHGKICKPSLHRKSLFSSSLLLQSKHQKWLFSWSLLRQKSDFRCSDFTYGVKKDHNIKNQNINYLWHITYG